MTTPDVWLAGPVEGVPALLQPAAHALLQAQRDVERHAVLLPEARLWTEAGGAASLGFHLKHLIGATDRLITYARGESLSAEQKAWLAAEGTRSEESIAELIKQFRLIVDRALTQLRSTPETELTTPRSIGRSALPTTVGGCLFHAAEHAARHAGQVVTTVKVLIGDGREA